MNTTTFKINTENLKDFINYCIENKLEKSQVKAIIQSNNLQEDIAERVYSKYCCEINSKLGWKIISLGGFFLLTAFAFPFLIDYANPLFKVSLYGFTSMGGILSMYGLYKVIG